MGCRYAIRRSGPSTSTGATRGEEPGQGAEGADFNDESLGELVERIVLHSFDPVPGDEGESCASPHSRRQLEVVATLRSMYGVSSDPHAARSFDRDVADES
jgi:hypothetical protein